MINFSDKHIQIATPNDVPQLVKLLNQAYRGKESKKGWTTEADLIAGEVRTDESNVKTVINNIDSVMLKYMDEECNIIGCVNLQKHSKKLYLGMFAVSPTKQGGGIGKRLLLAAEEYAKQQNCIAIYMTVISVRTELINWYKRHGYADTGNKKAFEEDGLSGKLLQPLEFIVLEKDIVS